MLMPFNTQHEKLQRLMNRFTNLRTLNLHSLAAVGDGVVDILNRCPSALTLKSIALENCALSYSCTHSFQLRNLESLTLTGNSIYSRMALLLKNSSNLKSLTFQQCPALRDKDIEALSQTLPSLESLVLNHTNTSKPVASFPKLIHASFLDEYHLESLSKFNCPALKVLNLSFCVRLSENQIEKIVKDSPALETLILAKCSGVHSLDLDSKKLRNLDISFTHNLSTLRLKCPSLENLDATYCSSLKKITLENCYTLVVLELGGLVQLRELTITKAWNLKRLNLQGCRGLNYCHIDCPNLQFVNLEGCRRSSVRFCKSIQDVVKLEKETLLRRGVPR